MDLIESFRSYIAQHHLFSRGNRLLVAVSGGVDSVVLCELCHQTGYPFEIAHCNFQLRGEESLRDEKFVRSLAEKYHVKIWVTHFDTTEYAASYKLSIQEAARELRYTWFNKILEENSFSFLLTAHHLDDSIETSLMNFFKGTGIAGLRGILPRQGKIIRPLLFAGKQELQDYALLHSLQWVEDSSNESDKYTRNYFRHQVIPFIQKIYPGVEKNLAQNLTRFRDTELLYHQSIDWYKKKLLTVKENEVHIPVLKLQQVAPFTTVLYEIIREFGFSPAQTNEVASLLESDSGRYVQSFTHRIIRNRAWLIVVPVKTTEASLVPIEKPGKYHFPGGSLELSSHSASQPETDKYIACLDAASIQFPLILRPWKTGDYFYPLGMTKKKKLARFFIDQKLSTTEKENTWVLEMDKKIVWVVGQRIDNRFKLKETTRDILRIIYKATDK
ncbi:MAG TPA: tRNA lysidine(34) synthetase TilS [Chitinophagaceae bacterium]|nr:tRNA lysidine(34) synthetase TilS [Chitinophagaceae bacterium]